MTDSVIQKAIALILLIGVGCLLRRKFQDPAATGAIRTFVLNVALPATIFLSTIEIDTQLDVLLLPTFALTVNIVLLFTGLFLTRLLMRKSNASKTRALVLLFPSLAPGLTVYPFIEQFVGRQGLAWAALADMGNKFFVLIGLYALAIYWFQQEAAQTQAETSNANKTGKAQWHNIGRFLLTEPVNIAIVVGIAFAVCNLDQEIIPLALTDVLQKLSLCSTPLILFYIGISLNLKSLQFGKVLMILLVKAGVGFLLSAGMIMLVRPTNLEIITLFVALPQASFSLWPLLHANKINAQKLDKNSSKEVSTNFFDTEFATCLLAMSFPFSILTLLMVFASGSFFMQPDHLGLAGGAFLGLFALLAIYQGLPIQLQSPLQMQVRLRSPLLKAQAPHNGMAVSSESMVVDGAETAAQLPVSISSAELPLQQDLPQKPVLPQKSVLPEKPVLPQKSRAIATQFSLQDERLKRVNQLIRRYLETEMEHLPFHFQMESILKDRVLMIVVQHANQRIIEPEITLQYLEKELHLLEIDFLTQIRFYFRLNGERRPYGYYLISFYPEEAKKLIASRD